MAVIENVVVVVLAGELAHVVGFVNVSVAGAVLTTEIVAGVVVVQDFKSDCSDIVPSVVAPSVQADAATPLKLRVAALAAALEIAMEINRVPICTHERIVIDMRDINLMFLARGHIGFEQKRIVISAAVAIALFSEGGLQPLVLF